jgi:prepilin-type N-terminal cleavage/methylation domain-containing protein
MKKRRRAFSLLEILLVVTLMGIVAGMGLVNSRRAVTAGQASGLAELVAEQLRGARNRAVSQNLPVAVAFPSGNGSFAHSQSLYLLEGAENPRQTRTTDYAREYPDSQIFVGTWGATAVSRDDMQAGTQGQELSLANWGAPNQKDYTLMFTPAGTVKSNGLPHFNGQYHVVVCSGLTTTAGAAPTGTLPTSLSYFKLDSVVQPTTISIGLSGSVTVQSGFPDGARLPESNTGQSGAAAVPPAAAASNASPVIKSAKLQANPTMPFGLEPGTQISSVIEATDPDGDPLYVEFSTTPPGLGKFSSPTRSQMEWVPSATGPGHYRANWVWTAPEGTAVGSSITLNYQITDGRGGTVGGDLGNGFKSGKPQHRIAFTRAEKISSPENELVTCRPDGTGMTVIAPKLTGTHHIYPLFSPDGKKILYIEDSPRRIKWCYADGTGTKTLLNTNFRGDLSWAPDSRTALYFSQAFEICAVDTVTGTARQLTNSPGGRYSTQPICSPVPVDGEYRVAYNFEDSKICSVRLRDGGDYKVHYTKPYGAASPYWSPDGTKLIFLSDYDHLWMRDIVSNALTDLGPTRGGGWPEQLKFSPDGQYVAYITDYWDGDLVVTGVDGKHPDTGAPGHKVVHAGNTRGYAWSPDSKSLIFDVKISSDYKSEIGITDVLGARTVTKLNMPAGQSYFEPHWSSAKD